MLARTPEEAIERLKILMSQSDMTVESVTEQLAANGRVSRTSEKQSSHSLHIPTTTASENFSFSSQAADASFAQDLPSNISLTSSPSKSHKAPMSLDADVVEALLGSLERKQRECDKAYELIRGKNVGRALMEQTASIRTETGGQIEFRGGSPHAARKGKRPQGMKWKVVRPSPDRSSLGGRVISLLVKHAKDTDMTSQEMRQKYQQAVKDAAGLRRKLKSVEATCSSLEKQVKQHQEEESSLRQRLMEQRVKVSRQAGREGKVQEDMESLRQQVAKERAEHEITKQRLSSLHRSQKMSKEAANAAVNAELQQERQQTADLRDQLADTHHELGKSAEEVSRLKEMVEHKSAQLLAVVHQLQEERLAAESHRGQAATSERRAQDISAAARDAVTAADSLSAKLRDQSATIKAVKAERDHARANLDRLTKEVSNLRVALDESVGVQATCKRKLEMLEDDVRSVCDNLETAVGKEPSVLQDGDPIHRLRTASDALVRLLGLERQRLHRNIEALEQEAAQRQQDSARLRSEVLRLKGELGVVQAQAQERESSLRQRIRRAEQDRDECLAAAGRADALLAKLAKSSPLST